MDNNKGVQKIQDGSSFDRLKWRFIVPFLLLSLLIVLFMGGLAFWFFDLKNHARLFFLYLSLGTTAGLVIAILYSQSVAKPFIGSLRQMTQSIKKVSKGVFSHPVRLESDYFQALQDCFNEMSETLETRQQTLSDDRLNILAILSDMVEGVLVLDAQGRIILVNASFEKIFNVNRQDLIGGFHYEKLRHHPLNELVDSVIETGLPSACEISLNLLTKQTLEVQASVAQPFEKGSVVLVFHDITEKKRLEEIRKDFVANISHELRTPISIIKGYLETLVEGKIEDQQQTKDFLEILQKNSDRIDHIIKDLLQLSRIESGLDPVRPVQILLKEHIEKNVVLFKPLFQKKKQTLTMTIPSDLKLMADTEKLNQVITNLLDNAIKYTKESGEIEISAVKKDDKTTLHIKDNGIGIPERDLLRIFERFYRVDRTRSRALGGTGLGLSIVKHIVEAHGGTVSVKSHPDMGSQFTLTFLSTLKST